MVHVAWHLLAALGALNLAWLVRRDARGLFAACWVLFAVGVLINLAKDF